MMPLSEEEQTLDLIYGAAVEPALWHDVLDRLVTAVGGEHGVLTRLNIEDGTGVAPVATDPSGLADYFAYYSGINPLQIVDDVSTYMNVWKPAVLVDEDVISRDIFEASEYYNDFIRPIGAEWGMMIRLDLSGLDVAAVSIGRSIHRGRFEGSEVASAARLQPHLIRASAMGERIAALQGLNGDLATTLDNASSASFLLDGEGCILHANAPGEKLLSKGDVLRAVGGRLSGATLDAAGALAKLIGKAGTPDWERRSGGSLQLKAAGRGSGLKLTASPMRLEQATVFARGPAVLVCVSDEGADASSLETRFALTKAEARLAKALCEGRSLREVAAQYQVSSNTVRNQLASIFCKTGTHRQVELVRLLIGNTTKEPA